MARVAPVIAFMLAAIALVLAIIATVRARHRCDARVVYEERHVAAAALLSALDAPGDGVSGLHIRRDRARKVGIDDDILLTAVMGEPMTHRLALSGTVQTPIARDASETLLDYRIGGSRHVLLLHIDGSLKQR